MKKIERLIIAGNKHIDSISPISGANNMKFLWISDNKIKDLSPIESMLTLESLYVEDNCIIDFSAVEYLKQNGKLTSVSGDSAEEQDYARCE